MPVTASVLTTLLANIAVNLRDTTNFANLSALKLSTLAQIIVPRLTPSFQGAVPFCQVAIGECTKDGADGREDRQQVLIHVVHGILSDPNGYHTMKGTASVEAINTVAEEIEKALTRPEPYNYAPFNTGSYTAQTGVHAAYPVSWTPVELVDFPFREGVFWLVQTLTMEYRIWKGV